MKVGSLSLLKGSWAHRCLLFSHKVQVANTIGITTAIPIHSKVRVVCLVIVCWFLENSAFGKKKIHFLYPHGLAVPVAHSQVCSWTRPRIQLAKSCFSIILNRRVNIMPLFCLNYWTIRTMWGVIPGRVQPCMQLFFVVIVKRQILKHIQKWTEGRVSGQQNLCKEFKHWHPLFKTKRFAWNSSHL